MSLVTRGAGSEYTPAYIISGVPFVTSSTVGIGKGWSVSFPTVTRTLTLKNDSGGNLAVAFSANGLKAANSNYFTLFASESFSGELRIKELFLSGSGPGTSAFSIIAGLTTIHSTMFPTLTGSDAGTYGIG